MKYKFAVPKSARALMAVAAIVIIGGLVSADTPHIVGHYVERFIGKDANVAVAAVTGEAATSPAMDASQYTVAVLNAANELQLSPVSSQPSVTSHLTDLAKKRKDVMLKTMVTDPQAVIDSALSAEAVSQFPASIRPLFEKQAALKGTFEAYHIDKADGSSRYEFYLTDEVTGKRYQLYFAGDRFPDSQTGQNIQLNGVSLDAHMAVPESSVLSVSLNPNPNIPPNTFGAQKVLVMLVNFPHDTSQPATVAQIQARMEEVNKFTKENSFNQAWMVGVKTPTKAADVTPWMTISVASTSACSQYAVANPANEAATAAGYTLTDYNRYMYVFPGKCFFWGIATIGGDPSRLWISAGYGTPMQVFTHEFGHNFALVHSHSLPCSATGCVHDEYGDVYDAMGLVERDAVRGHFNAFQKSRLGWLNHNVSPPITLVNTNGTYTIYPYELNNKQPKAMQVLKNASTNTYYYVEYRAGLGFDAGKTAVILHSASPSPGNADTSFLWDLNRIATTTDWILNLNQTHQNPNSGITFTNVGQSTTSARIKVHMGPVVCIASNPSLSLSTTTVRISAGKSVSVVYKITNNDTPTCPTSNFRVTPAFPAGFTQSPTPINRVLAPGASVLGKFIITISPSVPKSTYTLKEIVQNTSTSTPYKFTRSFKIIVQ